VRLRPFIASDDDQLISWLRSADELFLFTGPLLTFPLTSGQLDTLRTDATITQFTAEHDGAVVGHIELVSTGEAEARIARVIVDPARQGQGLGEKLLLAVIAEAGSRGIRVLTLRVFPTNARAIALYEKVGFTDAGVEEGANFMRLELP
jgi:ribosomal protein S18 acetylase RimI-like enzyme